MKDRLTVFISYSWDSPEHKEWVLKLANYLIEKAGCAVLLDQFDLAAGKELTHFMENGLEKADKVIIVLTEDYKKRADDRQGGTGFEYSLISQGLYDLQANNDKFIPILRQGKKAISAPIFLGTKIYHSMKDDSKFENDAFNLSRVLYEKPKVVRPEYGPIPDFENPDYDPIVAMANEVSTKGKVNQELDRILHSTEGVHLAQKEVNNLFDKIQGKGVKYTEKTEYRFNVSIDPYQTHLIVNSLRYSVSIEWCMACRNSTNDAILVVKKWNGIANLQHNYTGYFPGEEPKIIDRVVYTADLDRDKNIIWRKNETETVNNSKLEQALFLYIMESIQQENEKKFRKGTKI